MGWPQLWRSSCLKLAGNFLERFGNFWSVLNKGIVSVTSFCALVADTSLDTRWLLVATTVLTICEHSLTDSELSWSSQRWKRPVSVRTRCALLRTFNSVTFL